jgi:hypothetical protein
MDPKLIEKDILLNKSLETTAKSFKKASSLYIQNQLSTMNDQNQISNVNIGNNSDCNQMASSIETNQLPNTASSSSSSSSAAAATSYYIMDLDINCDSLMPEIMGSNGSKAITNSKEMIFSRITYLAKEACKTVEKLDIAIAKRKQKKEKIETQ